MDLTNIFRRVANSKRKFIDDFDSEVNIARELDFFDQSIELMIRAKKFIFQESAIDHLDGGAEFSAACLAEGIFTLPFDECLFVGKSDAILAWNDNGVQFRHISLLYENDDEIVAPTLIKYSLTKPSISNEFSNYAFEYANDWVADMLAKNRDQQKTHDKTRVNMLLGFVGLLRTDGMSAKPHTPDPKLQAARIKNGKAPLYEHTEIFINRANFTQNGGSKISEYTPKRLHWRRGHVRRLPNGTMTAVRPCLVGDKARGFITHDYNVASPIK